MSAQKLIFKMERKRKLTNRLEEQFITELSSTVYTYNTWGGDAYDFRTRVEELVKEYRSKKQVNGARAKAHFKLKAHWPLSGSGRYLNYGSLLRDDDASGTAIISLSWEQKN